MTRGCQPQAVSASDGRLSLAQGNGRGEGEDLVETLRVPRGQGGLQDGKAGYLRAHPFKAGGDGLFPYEVEALFLSRHTDEVKDSSSPLDGVAIDPRFVPRDPLGAPGLETFQSRLVSVDDSGFFHDAQDRFHDWMVYPKIHQT